MVENLLLSSHEFHVDEVFQRPSFVLGGPERESVRQTKIDAVDLLHGGKLIPE